MPVLKNTKRELFAQGLVSGKSAQQAYIDAGFAAKGCRGHAHDLRLKPIVAARIAELQENLNRTVAATTAITKTYVLEKLQKNLERALQEEAVYDREGEPTGEYRYEGAVANRALELMGKELGMFKDRIVPENPDGTNVNALAVIYVTGKGDHGEGDNS
jgi:phage terminase small subunit